MAKLSYCEAEALGLATGKDSTDDQVLPFQMAARILPDTSAEPMKMISLRVGASAAAIMEMSSVRLRPVVPTPLQPEGPQSA
ncbi:hypothetical protein AQB9606_04657 [Aquabacterium sp. CECT 9606]|nr:hypothetical protein AQB9606_04657 [Aquabacterium sp. CECT 9606]